MRGSIVKRTGKGKSNGKPVTLYYIVYTVAGKQKWETVPSPRTRKHAEKLLAERLSQMNKEEYIEPKKVTFKQFQDIWMKNYAQLEIRPSTLARSYSLFRVHILPAFGELELSKIDVEDIQRFKAEKLSSGLSPQSVKHMIRLIRQMLNHAIDWKYLRNNPAQKIKDPKIPKQEMDCLSPEEVRVFLEHVPEKWYAFFLTAIATGMRLGEVLAMRWRNLDWNQSTYFVRETVTRKTEVQEAGFAEVKTEGSAQVVDLTPRCLSALTEHRKKQAELKLKAGQQYADLDLIFATLKGKPLNDRNIVNRVFHPTLEVAGLRRFRFHDLRHTCASLLIAQGESPKYIQSQLRHASIQITFDRYGHLFPETNREAARRLDETLFGSGRKVARAN